MNAFKIIIGEYRLIYYNKYIMLAFGEYTLSAKESIYLPINRWLNLCILLLFDKRVRIFRLLTLVNMKRNY